MEHTGKLGTALAAATLALGIPAVAAAQDYPTGLQDGQIDTTLSDQGDVDTGSQVATIDQAMADSTISAKALSDIGQVSSADVAVVSMNDMNLTAEQRYTIAQNSDPSMAAAVQSALENTTVGEYNGDTPSLADHLRAIGVDPASVVALSVGDDGVVTVFTQ